MDSHASTRRFWAKRFRDDFTISDHREYLRGRLSRGYGHGFGYWTILKRDQVSFLGWVFALPYDDAEDDVEIGWRLKPSARGHGYAREAALCLVHHLQMVGRFRQAIAIIHPRNTRSKKVADALGMTYVRSILAFDEAFDLYLRPFDPLPSAPTSTIIRPVPHPG